MAGKNLTPVVRSLELRDLQVLGNRSAAANGELRTMHQSISSTANILLSLESHRSEAVYLGRHEKQAGPGLPSVQHYEAPNDGKATQIWYQLPPCDKLPPSFEQRRRASRASCWGEPWL